MGVSFFPRKFSNASACLTARRLGDGRLKKGRPRRLSRRGYLPTCGVGKSASWWRPLRRFPNHGRSRQASWQGHAAYAPAHRCDLADAARRADLGSRRVPGHVPGGPAGHLWPPSPRPPTRGGSGNWPNGPVRFGGRNGGRLDRRSKSEQKP
jgi:hypothetical protein